MAGLSGLEWTDLSHYRGINQWAYFALCFALCYALPNSQSWVGWDGENNDTRWRWRPSTAWAVACGLLLAAGLLLAGNTTEFIYFQF
jgi:hypothetical protein